MVSHVHGTTRSHFMPVRLQFGKVVLNHSRARTLYSYGRERLLWTSADRVLTVSNAIKRDLASNYGIASHKVRVVYNGVDTNVFKPIMDPLTPNELQPFEGKKVVLFVGHFGLRKGLLFLIRAMKKVTAEVRDARLVCVGGTPSWLGENEYWTYLTNELESQELREKVLLLDSVPNHLLPTYLSLSKVLVLPSYYEAFGKVVIEAMACARPVIATRRGGAEEVVEDGKTGLLVNYGSVQEIANALVTLLQDEPRARIMGNEGLKTVEAKFTWREVAHRVSEAYAELLEETPSMQSAYR